MDATGQGEGLDIVRPWDPAIRWSDGAAPESTAQGEYIASRLPSLLCVIEGRRPMTFHTRRLRRSEMRDVECLVAEPLKRESSFACGVVAVTMPDGERVTPAGTRWTGDEMDRFDFATVEDVGSVVVHRSRVPFDLHPGFVAPPSSRAASAACLYPCAEPNPSGAAPSNPAPAVSSGT